MIVKNFVLVSLGCVVFLSACYSRRINLADSVVREYSFVKEIIKTNTFKLTTYSRVSEKGKPVDVYIEGDGFAWASRGKLSVDPTPTKPMVLELAGKDDSANVLYIARPCQYTNLKEDQFCNSKYWSSDRFSKEVIDSVNDAITHFVNKYEIKGVNLIGYSGGGAVATIIAAQRKDVLSLRTVAGNLDHVEVNKYHKVTQLTNSLNAIDYADKLSNLPQYHFSGGEDKIVPIFIAENFAEKAEKGNKCVKVAVVKGVGHEKGWVENWKYLLSQPVVCGSGK